MGGINTLGGQYGGVKIRIGGWSQVGVVAEETLGDRKEMFGINRTADGMTEAILRVFN